MFKSSHLTSSMLSLFQRRKSSIERPNHRIQWLSHHIPKTAGSSLNRSYVNAFGKSRIYGVYATSGASDMSLGNPTFIPFRARVLHGHFRPHTNHLKTFPNSKKIVWVRDPIERLWSHVGHLLEIGTPHPQFELLKKRYLTNTNCSREEMVYDLIVNGSEPSLTQIYSRFFSLVPLKSFDFVGSVHDYSGSMEKLARLTNVSLPHNYVNVRNTHNNDVPVSIKRLEHHLASEYDIVRRYL